MIEYDRNATRRVDQCFRSGFYAILIHLYPFYVKGVHESMKSEVHNFRGMRGSDWLWYWPHIQGMGLSDVSLGKMKRC